MTLATPNAQVSKIKPSALPVSCPPRALNRTAAAEYVGVSPSKFDELVDDHRMPPPKTIDRRRVWDRLELDAAFTALPSATSENPWDAVL